MEDTYLAAEDCQMFTQTPPATTKRTFLTVPLEVRILIFVEIFKSLRPTPRPARGSPRGSSLNEVPLHLSILLSCKQIREEALPVYFQLPIYRFYGFFDKEERYCISKETVSQILKVRVSAKDIANLLVRHGLSLELSWKKFREAFGSVREVHINLALPNLLWEPFDALGAFQQDKIILLVQHMYHNTQGIRVHIHMSGNVEIPDAQILVSGVPIDLKIDPKRRVYIYNYSNFAGMLKGRARADWEVGLGLAIEKLGLAMDDVKLVER